MLCLQSWCYFFQMDLMPFINKAGCECLNESDEHGFDNCLRKDMTFLESDCDEQVIECLRLVEIINIYTCYCFFIMFPSHGFMSLLPRWPVLFHFVTFIFFDPCPLTMQTDPTPFLCSVWPAGGLGRITELLEWPHYWAEPFPLLSPFVHSWSAFHTFYPPKWVCPWEIETTN